MSASLLILAAGLGTRFKGGIKQLTPVGTDGELLMEYSVADAVRAGFDKVIFIIRRDIKEQFEELIGSRLRKYVKVCCCYQDMDDLPDGFSVPEGRTKPWGTVHAVLAARELISEPFLIINADDYYGQAAYKNVYDFLTNPRRKQGQHCMSGFILGNTLSTTGTVTRGICNADENDMLVSVTETYTISRQESGIIQGTRDGEIVTVSPDSIASMNMWGCGQEIVPQLERCFGEFLGGIGRNELKAELALPTAFDKLIKSGEISVKVIPTHDKWYGMTHTEDMPEIKEAFADMTRKGIYNVPLFDAREEMNVTA